MAGAFDFLDNLATQVGNVAGRAVDVAGNVAQATAAQQAARAQNDQTAVRTTAVAQSAPANTTYMWLAVGAIVLVAVVVLIKVRR